MMSGGRAVHCVQQNVVVPPGVAVPFGAPPPAAQLPGVTAL